MLQIDEGAERWLKSKAAKEHWRVASWYELVDLIQDGYVCWYKCANRYCKVTEVKHLMSLFKRTFCNHIHDLARAKMLESQAIVPNDDDEVPDVADYSAFDDVQLRARLKEAPAHVAEILSRLTDDAFLKALRKPHRRFLDGTRQTTNEKLCGMVNLDPAEVRLQADLVTYLSD